VDGQSDEIQGGDRCQGHQRQHGGDDQGGAGAEREEKHRDDKTDADRHVEADTGQPVERIGALIEQEPVLQAVGQAALEGGELGFDIGHPGIDLQIAFHFRGNQNCLAAVEIGERRGRLPDGLADRGDVADPGHEARSGRCQGDVGDPVGSGDFACDFDQKVGLRPVQAPGTDLGVGIADCGCDRVRGQAEGGQPAGIDLDQNLFGLFAEPFDDFRSRNLAQPVLQVFRVAAGDGDRDAAMTRGYGADGGIGARPVVVETRFRHTVRQDLSGISESIPDLRPGLFDAFVGDEGGQFHGDQGNPGARDRCQFGNFRDFAQFLLDLLRHQRFDPFRVGAGIGRHDGREKVGDRRVFLAADRQEGGQAGGNDDEDEKRGQPLLTKEQRFHDPTPSARLRSGARLPRPV